MSYKLRPRQEIAVKNMVDFVNNKKKDKGIFIYPTSFGKSLVISSVASKFPDKYFINVTNSKELVSQNYEKYVSYGLEADLCSASLKSNSVGKVTFATIGTLVQHLNFFKDKDVIILDDECFPGDTPILTDNGLINIGNLYKLFKSGAELPKAKSFNEVTNQFEYKKILNVKNNGKKETVKLNFYPATVVETTSNHEFLTTEGWKKASELIQGDAILTSFDLNHKNSYKQLNNDQFDFIIGTSLGDGSLREDKCLKNTTRISFTHGAKQEEYIRWKSSLLNCEGSVSFVKENGYSSRPAFRMNSKKFYFEDRYKSYEEQIDCLNYKSLAVLWMDDGCLSSENYGKLYSLHDNKNLVNLLQQKIESLGIKSSKVFETKSSSSGRALWYIGIKKEGINQLFKKCAKYMHKSMGYKVNQLHKKLVGSYKWNRDVLSNVIIYNNLSECVTKKVVYDMEVEDNHNYIVSSKKTYKHNKYLRSKEPRTTEGIVVHNCHSGSKVGSQLGEFIKKIPKCKLIGTTASPFRLSGGMDGTTLKMMNRDRECIYKSIEDVVQIKEVIEQGYWSKLIYQQKVVDESSLELNGSGTDFTVESLKAFGENNNIVDRCVEEAKILIAQGRKSILISVPFIEDARRIEDKLESCKSVYSGMKASERDSIISDFKALKIKVVSQVSILSIGFDHPALDALIMAKPSNSLTFVYQLIGRLVRIHPDKKDAIIVDLSGNISKFGKVEDITIETNDYTSGWAVFSKDDLLTGYPLNTTRRPNRKSLQAKLKRKTEGKNNPDPKFYFGKYKDKLVSEVYKENKSYLTWLLDQKDFKWYGEVGTNLKKAIRIVLGLEVFVESAPKEKVNTKQLLEEYTNSIRSLQDLKDIW